VPADKHAVHRYDPAVFGMADATPEARSGAYRERFGALL
jgi:phosphatidylethanolamine-binding protein (PEBP) family uncharacterized protein